MRGLRVLQYTNLLVGGTTATSRAVKEAYQTSSGCLDNSQKLQSTSHLPHILELAGRKATLSYPINYHATEPFPIVIAFQDAGQTVKEFVRASQLSNNTLNKEAIVIYPHRPEHGWSSEEQYRNVSAQDFSSDASRAIRDEFGWISTLLNYVETNFCVDLSRIYGLGLGTGAGFVHLLACHENLSRRLAAFSLVNAALFQSDDSSLGVWASCKARSPSTPILEVHANANTQNRYFGKRGDPTLRLPDWLSLWSQQNDCGVIDGPTTMSDWSPAAYVTKLTHGQVSEAMMYGGGASRVSYRCVASGKGGASNNGDEASHPLANHAHDDEISAEQLLAGLYAQQWTPEPDDRDEGATILHYVLHGPVHGWPRGSLKHEEMVVVNGVEVAAPGEPYFDTTRVVLDWLYSHRLPSTLLHHREDANILGSGALVDAENERTSQRSQGDDVYRKPRDEL